MDTWLLNIFEPKMSSNLELAHIELLNQQKELTWLIEENKGNYVLIT